MFKDVRTLAVYVTDMARAKTFYTETLRFEVSADLGPSLCFLKSKSGSFHIYLEGGKKPGSADGETSRLSFFLEAEKSVLETFAALKSAGVKLLQDAPEQVGEAIYWFQFEDPDGNILEVSGGP